MAALAVFLLLGGVAGLVCGVVVAVAVPAITSRLEPAVSRRRRTELVKSAPAIADLLCASLRAGVPLERAVPVVAAAVGSASGPVLMDVHRRVQLGQPVESAWAAVADTPGLGGIARAVARSHRTGAPLADVLGQAARDLRADAVAASLAQVRAAGVRAVLPLGLCLLPAFVLLGIVPIVGGLLPSL